MFLVNRTFSPKSRMTLSKGRLSFNLRTFSERKKEKNWEAKKTFFSSKKGVKNQFFRYLIAAGEPNVKSKASFFNLFFLFRGYLKQQSEMDNPHRPTPLNRLGPGQKWLPGYFSGVQKRASLARRLISLSISCKLAISLSECKTNKCFFFSFSFRSLVSVQEKWPLV